MSQILAPVFSFDRLSEFGLGKAVDFIHGRCPKPEDFNIGQSLPSLIQYLSHVSTQPYYALGSNQGGLYMERDWLIAKSADKPAARVHRIHRSDLDRHAHNHPWNHFSVILEHGYFELVPSTDGQNHFECMPDELRATMHCWEPLTAIRRHPGDVVFRSPENRHKLVVLAPDKKPLTLFATAPKGVDWGFFTESGFVVHTQYLGIDVQEMDTQTGKQS